MPNSPPKRDLVVDASVIIATKNRPLGLAHRLRALARHDTRKGFEVIVADDGPSPRLRPGDLHHCLRARVLFSAVRPARARNRGLEAATAPLILFTDDETGPCRRWTEAACLHMDDHTDTLASRARSCLLRSIHSTNVARAITSRVRIGGATSLTRGKRSSGWPDSRRSSPAHAEDLDHAFRALRLGAIGFAKDFVVTHYPSRVTPAEGLSFSDIVRENKALRSDIVLFSRYPGRYASKVPLRLMPVVRHRRYLAETVRRERDAMIGTPRRFTRFSVAVAAGLAGALATAVHPGRHR